MTHCESGVHDRPTTYSRKARAQPKASLPEPASLQPPSTQTWKIEERYGLDLGLLDRAGNPAVDCPESLLGRLKIASLSKRPCRGADEGEDP